MAKGKEEESEHDDLFQEIARDAINRQLKPLSFYAKRVAEDHLNEVSDYYSRLEKAMKGSY